MEFRRADCEDCEWATTLPRDNAEHAKRVHEDETGHVVVLDYPEDG